ncbi:MAG: hypothetical protein RJA44_2396 [Pseudomonadota bacterium]|jgi:two-component system sensor histidine kinase QseC
MRLRPRSLLGQLLAWALGTQLLVGLVLVGSAFVASLTEADELIDGQLASVATLLLSERHPDFSISQPALPQPFVHGQRQDYQQLISAVIWNATGQIVSYTGDAPLPSFDQPEGFATLTLGQPPREWRSFTMWDGPGHARRVQVLLDVAARDQLAWDIGRQVSAPGLWLLPLVALTLGLALRRGLQPLRRLSEEVHALDIRHHAPLPVEQRQREFLPVIEAINALSARHHAALQREQQLASELAHEMRTPLASLSLNAQALLGQAGDLPPEQQAVLRRLEHDALRAGHVLGQLLSLARASRAELAEAAVPVDLAGLAREVVAEYGQTALDSDHDLALLAPEALPLQGHPVLLALALRNLIENALSHTPRGSCVEVQLDAAQRWLQVCDDGVRRRLQPAGTPKRDEAPPLALGLGLGHRVVAKIASIHDASFGPAEPPEGFDTCYRIDFNAGVTAAPSHADAR